MPFASGNSYIVKARNILSTMFKKWVYLVLLLVLATRITLLVTPSVGLAANLPNIWHPKPGATWYWQLSGTVDTSVSAEVYDVDLFDNTKQLSDELHEKGHKAICYVNVGAYEDWREDSYKFTTDRKEPESDGSNLDRNIVRNSYEGWNGEYWLNIRKKKVRGIMKERFEECKRKGFDGVEPDNIDSYDPSEKTGFNITQEDQINYDEWLAETAHSFGLSIGLKNDSGNAEDLVDTFDWALTEDFFAQDWCKNMKPFIEEGKAVLAAEYTDQMNPTTFTDTVCNQVQQMKFSAILLNRDLNGKPTAECSY